MKFTSTTWQVYIILCSDRSFYTGITTDIVRRLCQHAEGQGAKYFRGRQPLEVVYLESGHTRSSATKREAEIKAMTRTEKSLLQNLKSFGRYPEGSGSREPNP